MPTDLPPFVLHERRRVGERIRQLRTERGLSQETLAELAMLDRKTIGRIELGQYPTSIDSLIMIASALGLSLSTMVGE